MRTDITIHGTLPVFPGFYCTHFEADEDYELEALSETHGFRVCYDDVKWDYDSYRTAVAESVTATVERVINDEFGLDVSITFEGIDSPREYNFRNDSIDIELKMSGADYETVMRIVHDNREELEKWLEERFKSRSGLWSLYDHTWKAWTCGGGYLDPEHKDFGSCMTWMLDGLLEVVAEYDSHCLWNDTETIYPEGELVMADPTDAQYEDMFADVFVDVFLEEWADVGHNTLIMQEAEARAELFGITVRECLVDYYKLNILGVMTGVKDLPKARLEQWLKDWEKDAASNREQIREEYESMQLQSN